MPDVPGVKTWKRIGKDPTRCVRTIDGVGAGAIYGVHNDTLVNLKRAVLERVLYISKNGRLQPVEQPRSPNIFSSLKSIRNRVLRHVPSTTPVSLGHYPELYKGRKRKVYERAVQSLLVQPCTAKDAEIRAFVKAEKVAFSAKGDPAPRLIQPRTPRYTASLGRFLKPFEHVLIKGFEKAFGYPVIMKGRNATETASAIRSCWDSYTHPVAIGLDASRFDQHCSVQALKFEHSWYLCKFGNNRELRRLLNMQLKCVGTGFCRDGGIKYTKDGSRMSGDINTSMGNCIIMCSVILGFFENHKLRAHLVNNGDDCVVICEQRDLHRLHSIGEWCLDFGFDIKIEKPVTTFEKIVFCQTQPVLTGSGWRMTRDPWTATSKDLVSLLGWADMGQFNTWRHAIGTCGLELTSGVPYWESFYRALWAPGESNGATEFVYDSGLGYMARNVVACDITPESRVSFYYAFDIPPDVQIALEREMPSIEYSPLVPMTSFEELTCCNNLYDQTLKETKTCCQTKWSSSSTLKCC